MSPAAESIVRRLDAARQQWWLFTLFTTAVLAICVSFGTLLACMLVDAWLQFSQWTLGVLLSVWLLLTIAMFAFVLRRVVRSKRTLEATARRVEAEFPEIGSDLINILQLDSSESKFIDSSFAQAEINQAASRVGMRRFEDAAKQVSRWRRFVYCMQTPRDLGESVSALVLLAVVAIVCHMMVPNLGSAANRLMKPWEFVPSVGKVEIVEVQPGDTEVVAGNSLEVTAKIKNPTGQAYKATLFVTNEGEAEAALPMSADEKHLVYSLTLPVVNKPLDYRLEIGDSQTKLFHVGITEKPTVSEVEVALSFPPYMGRKPEKFSQKQADLEAPQYTTATLRVHPTVPIAKGHVAMGSLKFTGAVEQDGALLVKMPLIKDGTFTVHLFNQAGHTDPNPRVNRVHVTPDRAPTVQLLKPPKQLTLAPGGDTEVMIRAGDDYGLGKVRLEMQVKTDPAAAGAPKGAGDGEPAPATAMPIVTVKDWTEFTSSKTVNCLHRLELDAAKVQSGQTVMVRAVVWDNRDLEIGSEILKAQEAASAWHAIKIVSAEAKQNEAMAQLDNLRNAIFKILEKQIVARGRAAEVLTKPQLPERTALGQDVRGAQLEIQQASKTLVDSITATDKKERLAIKRAMNELAVGKMVEAVGQCDALVKVQALEGYDPAVAALTGTQDQIIATLQKMLEITRQATSEVLKEMEKKMAGDLPQDVQDKLNDLAKKLDEALKQQKKVVEAAERLAKAPVEDFTKEKEELLEALKAAEDDWSKFMNELNTDMSKLPEQDFANPSALKELVEIQTEIKMAEDSLLKKTADIAVPLEQLGYEMAEEIQTNMEKWLPDTPDRERWSQEEATDDMAKEAPMAELPGELEDLIGELMEEEEDLFDEMEDVSSSAIDSLDKGAGWDVADGPISNNSAKGATGNRLPNTSEIAGRSGEGRQGKSSGEFVGDEAVGKGGRKTPSRLTPDPFVAGQVKDHSKDAQGGATGGGKESGQGGEGLEGPTRRTPGDRNLQRLAGKQAELRNKAEAVDVQFQVMNFHHTDLNEMIDVMGQIERDLRAGRYENALRQRSVLAEGMGNVKQYLAGEFEVRQDATPNLPSDIQKELLGSMADPSPAGWEELNREYFERLSSGAEE